MIFRRDLFVAVQSYTYWIQSKNLTTAYLLQVERHSLFFIVWSLTLIRHFYDFFFQIRLALHFTSTSHIYSTFPMKERECVHKSNFQRLYGFFSFLPSLLARALLVANTWPSHCERVQVPHLLSGYIVPTHYTQSSSTAGRIDVALSLYYIGHRY